MQTSPWLNTSLSFEERAKLLVKEMTTSEKLSQIPQRNEGILRFNMKPYVWWNEALHGLARSGAATVFPQAIAMAATFDPKGVEKMGEIIAKEGRARHHESQRQGDHGTYKGLTYWSPNVNIFRDPRWGRGHETYGEDPYLTAQLGVAYTKGLQGDHPKFLKAVSTPKHFAVHSGPEATRLSFDAVVDERDLRETYLPAFKACFDAGAKSVMTAYNAINGEPCSTNSYLVNDILRKEWGFDGAVVTDAGAGEALAEEHKTVSNLAEAIAKEINMGIDVAVGFEGDVPSAVQEAYDKGLFQDHAIDRAVYNQLLMKFRLGFFDSDDSVPMTDTPYTVIECEEHCRESLEASRKSLVLLRNQKELLPLSGSEISNIAVIGPNADSKDVLLGNYFGTPTRSSTILQGVLDRAPETCRVWHARGCEHLAPRTEMCAEDHDRYAEAVSVAQLSDVVVLCLGLNPSIEGEAGDAFNAEAGGDKTGIELPEVQEELVRKILATGKPVIALMVTGSNVVSPSLEKSGSTLVQAFYPGAHGGQAIAELLFGDFAPSGRLPVTFYQSTEDLPDFDDYAMDNRTYRFYKGRPVFPFGFGLSTTTFEYSNQHVDENGEHIAVTVDITNTGERAGEEIAQLYLSLEDRERTPIYQLAGIQRIHLEPQESQSVKFNLCKDDFLMVVKDGSTRLCEGAVTVHLGGTQPDEVSKMLCNSNHLSLKLNSVS
jgi:beta-glucosidase